MDGPNKTDETVQKMKGFFSSAFTKTKEVGSQAYNKTAFVAKQTYLQADAKYHDPQFQEDLSNKKQATKDMANKGYEGLKGGIMKGWNFVKEKTSDKPKQNDVDVINQEDEQPNQAESGYQDAFMQSQQQQQQQSQQPDFNNPYVNQENN